jgi:DNA-directed RNA polymerase subunit alpha
MRTSAKLRSAEVLRYQGKLQEAMDILDNIFGPAEQTAEYNYQRGATVAVRDGNFDEVLRLYNRALQYDDHHPGALFGLALENDRKGNDDEALQALRTSCFVFPSARRHPDQPRCGLRRSQ